MKKKPKTGGRKKGTPNKVTIQLKTAIEGALVAVGGQRYLEHIARKYPVAFCALLSRLMPKPQEVQQAKEVQMELTEDGLPVLNYDIARRIVFALRHAPELMKRIAESSQRPNGSTSSNRVHQL